MVSLCTGILDGTEKQRDIETLYPGLILRLPFSHRYQVFFRVPFSMLISPILMVGGSDEAGQAARASSRIGRTRPREEGDENNLGDAMAAAAAGGGTSPVSPPTIELKYGRKEEVPKKTSL